MSLTRIYLCSDVDNRLRLLKARTGITPNLLCRIGFCMSLEESGIPDISLYSADQSREFNRYTLTGQWDTFFFALLRERMAMDKLDLERELESQFKAHLSRGIMLLSQRIKTRTGLLRLVPLPSDDENCESHID